MAKHYEITLSETELRVLISTLTMLLKSVEDRVFVEEVELARLRDIMGKLLIKQ